MGSGKSSIGKRLASFLKYQYVDTDQLVVEKTGLTIAQIMEQRGEQAFRILETEALKELSEQKKIVISTGGGLILSSENQKLLQQFGTIIWLHAAPEVLFERAQRRAQRPLLEVEHPRRTFYQLLTTRLLIYEALSSIKIETTTLSHQQAVDAILDALSSNGM